MITTKPITNVAFVISLQGEINRQQAGVLENRLAEVLARGAGEVAVDLTGVTGNFSRSLIDVLLQAAKVIEAAEGDLLLVSREPNGGAYRLVRLDSRRLEDVRGLHPSLDAALLRVPEAKQPFISRSLRALWPNHRRRRTILTQPP